MRTGFSGSEETLLGRGAEFNGTLTFKIPYASKETHR